MAKFRLEMANGVMVTKSLEELKENWDLEKIVTYYNDGSLVIWLKDRYYTDLAEKIQKITATGAEAQKELCAVFGMEFKQDEVVDAEALAERKRKLDILRQFTSDDEVLKNVDHVAFNQENLADLLDEGVEKIYLCNGKFSVPLNISGKKYIGVADAEVYIGKDELQDFDKLGISFENVKFDEKYTRVCEDKENVIDLDRMRVLAKLYTNFYSHSYYNDVEKKYCICELHDKGIQMYQELCKRGDIKAYVELAEVYRSDSYCLDSTEGEDAYYSYSSSNTSIDKGKAKTLYSEAKKLLQNAIEAGNMDAYYVLGYMQGDFKLLQKGVELGSRKCKEAIVDIFLHGVPKIFGQRADLERAKILAEKYQCWKGMYNCYAFPYWPTPGYEPIKSNLNEAHKYLIKAVEAGDHQEETLAFNYNEYFNDINQSAEWAAKGYWQEEDLVVAIKCFNFLGSINWYSKKRGYINSMKYQEYVETRKKFVEKLKKLGVEDKFINEVIRSIPETEFRE